MDAAQSHAMALVREGDRDRYLSVLYAPEEKRGALFALYAFNVEIASIRDRIKEPMAGEIRLQWWRDALTNGVAGNPVADALIAAIAAYSLPLQAFMDYLDARIFDLYDDPMPSRTDLEGYCGETASALIQLSNLILDAEAAAGAAEIAGHAGCVQAIAGLLRLLPIHRARGQCYIPVDILAAVGLTRDTFLADEAGEAALRAVSAMAALGREHLARFEADARKLPKTLRPAFLPASLADAYFARIEREGEAALRHVAEISSVRRQWILMRRAVRGWR
jgi:phytoene synthase